MKKLTIADIYMIELSVIYKSVYKFFNELTKYNKIKMETKIEKIR